MNIKNSFTTSPIDITTDALSKLPALGKRSARRIVLHLLKNKDTEIDILLDTLTNLKQNVHKCKICGNIDTQEICKICSSHNRDKEKICVVSEVDDLWSLERTGVFSGLYHVLEGNISAGQNISANDIRIKELLSRLQLNEIKEVIFANHSNIYGQSTIYYIIDRINELKKLDKINNDLLISELAQGIPIGSDLEYIDEGTLNTAFKMRRKN